MINDKGIIIREPDGTTNETIDLQGASMYPAFVDCHMHLMGYGQHLSRGNVNHLKTNEAILAYIRTHLTPPVTYIEGYHPCGIHKSDLDDVSKDSFIYLRHEDYHGMTVNSKTLQRLNITSDDGVLLENDGTKALKSIEKNSNETLVTFLEKAYQSLYQYGVIAAHSDDLYYFNGYVDTLKAFDEASRHFPFYAHLLIHHETLSDYQIHGNIIQDNSYLELGAVKMFYDGTTGSKTALMNAPYVTGGHGERVNQVDVFHQYVLEARANQLPVAVHVIGDLGLEEVCQILREHPVKKGLKDRIIHASYATPKTYALIKDLDVFLDIQPQFLTTDLPHTLAYFTQEPHGIFPFKTYHDLNVSYGLSSDAPVEIPNPILGMYSAIFRDIDGVVYQPDERLNRMQALLGYTTHAWQLTNHHAGYLKPGYPAHLVITNKDILTTPKDAFLSIEVLETYIDGKRVFQHKKT
jgi:predicted amidohydrolase YtcJ